MKRWVIFSVLPFVLSCCAIHRPVEADRPEKNHPHAELTSKELLQVGISYNSQGKSEKALDVLRQAVEKDPGLVAGYREMGLALSRLNRLDEALVPLKKAVELDPSDVDASLLLGMIYDLKHDSAKALSVYEAALEKKPDHPELNHEYGLSLLMSEKPQKAVAALERAKMSLDDAGLLGDLGYAYLLAGKSKEAAETLKEAVHRDGTKPEVVFNLARACFSAGDNDCAMNALIRLIRLAPKEPGPYYNLGLLLEKQGKISKARKSIEKALKIAPGFVPAQKWIKSHSKVTHP